MIHRDCRITFSASSPPLSFSHEICEIHREKLVWCVCGGVNIHTIVGIFLTKRQITRSIVRISGSMTSHTLAVEPLYRLHKKKSREKQRERQTIPYLLSLLPCRIPSVKPLHTNIYNAQNNTARKHLSYYRIVQGKIIIILIRTRKNQEARSRGIFDADAILHNKRDTYIYPRHSHDSNENTFRGGKSN